MFSMRVAKGLSMIVHHQHILEYVNASNVLAEPAATVYPNVYPRRALSGTEQCRRRNVRLL